MANWRVAESGGSVEPSVKLAAAWILPAALGVSIYAALALRGLFADGALVLLRLMESGSFLADWDPPRWTAHVLQQFPAVLAMRMGVDDPGPLGILLGLGMYAVPLAFVAGCYFLAPPGYRSFFLFPLFHYLAGSEAGGFNGSAEAPVATAYFWFLLFLILFRTDGPIGRAAAVLIAVPAPWLHEALALLGPLLAFAAILRLGRKDAAAPVGRLVFGALALWFSAITVYDFYVVYARGHGRDSFMLATLALGFLFDPDLEHWTLRINVPALLGILAAGAIAFIWWEGRRGDTRPARVALGGFAFLSAALVAGTLWHGALFSPRAQFAARSWGALLSLPLGVLCLGSLLEPRWRTAWERRSTVTLMSILAAAQLGWQTVATGFWSSYVHDFRAVLASHEGLVPWTAAVREFPAADQWVLRRMAWDWTNPSLSFVLSPHGRVASAIASDDQTGYHPFDSDNPDDLPAGPRFDTTRYRAALLRQQSGAAAKQP